MIRSGRWTINPNFCDLEAPTRVTLTINGIDDPIIILEHAVCTVPKYSVMLTLAEILFLCEKMTERVNKDGK